MPSRNVTFSSDGLSLEGVFHLPAKGGPFPAVVVCHPHPRFGGSMDNNVVLAACHGLQNCGIAALRFNFRGVEGSEGTSAEGDGEVSDAAHALEYLKGLEETDDSRLGILGYSFGASITMEAVAQEASDVVRAMSVIACPAPALNNPQVQELTIPKLLLAGDMDHVVPADKFDALALRFAEPIEVHRLSGGDHFLRGHEQEISEVVGDFFHRWLSQ